MSRIDVSAARLYSAKMPFETTCSSCGQTSTVGAGLYLQFGHQANCVRCNKQISLPKLIPSEHLCTLSGHVLPETTDTVDAARSVSARVRAGSGRPSPGEWRFVRGAPIADLSNLLEALEDGNEEVRRGAARRLADADWQPTTRRERALWLFANSFLPRLRTEVGAEALEPVLAVLSKARVYLDKYLDRRIVDLMSDFLRETSEARLGEILTTLGDYRSEAGMTISRVRDEVGVEEKRLSEQKAREELHRTCPHDSFKSELYEEERRHVQWWRCDRCGFAKEENEWNAIGVFLRRSGPEAIRIDKEHLMESFQEILSRVKAGGRNR